MQFASLVTSNCLRELLIMPNEPPATPPHSQLPSYEDLQAERDLKGSFAQLLKDHEEIQRLFKSVSSQLETTPKIGEDHDLCREWNALFKVRSQYQGLAAFAAFLFGLDRNIENCIESHN